MKITSNKKYPEELRTFALTLHFYSVSAYSYVRKMFSNCLPHPKTLTKWYSSIDGSPGYTQEAIRALEIKVQAMKKENKSLICSLIMDEMSIRRHIQWNGKRQVGYIDYGFPLEGDSLPEAKEALVFLITGVNCRWKIPIAYFLVSGLSAQQKAYLVKGCLTMLAKINVIITSLTFDGTATNRTMANILGAEIDDVRHLKTYFPHPVSNQPIFIILDPCHMIKLIRNLLGDYGILFNGNGESIKWNYFTELVKLQESHDLHPAIKIRRRHLNYHKEKMKVKLAVQTFSDSVADALVYCNEDLKLTKFEGANATAKFCRYINNIFDILNSRNCLSKNVYKKPIYADCVEFVESYFQEATEYLISIKDHNNTNIVDGVRKTGFLGLLVTMKSIVGIVKYHVIEKRNLEYILTYKLSQDHLEMFFSNIRSKGGFNNNPTAIQFESAYKRLLIHVELTSSEAANCLAQDGTSILNVVSSNKNCSNQLDLFCDEEMDSELDDNDKNHYEIQVYSRFDIDVIDYIAGFVVKKCLKRINCHICCNALTEKDECSSLIRRKNKGGLTIPSKSTSFVCKMAEKTFRGFPHSFSKNNVNFIQRLITLGTARIITYPIFEEINYHFMEQDPMTNHLIQLVYNILKIYFTIRLHHRNASENEVDNRVRPLFTKLIHFRGQ